MTENLTPVLVGAGQLMQREFELEKMLDPLGMMVETARLAAEDAGGGKRLLNAIDSLAIVNVMSWRYENLPRLLAERLETHPREEIFTAQGGNIPQKLVNATAQKIAEGKVRVALLSGAEALYTRRAARRDGIKLPWLRGEVRTLINFGDEREGESELERVYGLNQPVSIYPVFENALRAWHNLDLDAHRRKMGRLCSRSTQVAAENPYAWFPEVHTPEEITAVTPENRMICFPYPKRMNAIMSVNQSASVIMTSVSAACAFGIPQDLWIYLWGGGDAMEDPWFVSERPNFHSSPSMSCAARAALTKAGVTMDEVDFLDLYSCFPCAVQIACDELGITEDDPRPLTVTGGLPYAGGPASNYSMHAIATMMEKLRAAPEAKGLVTGNGMYLSKHSAGVYSGTPKVPSSLTEVSWDEAAPAGEALTVALKAEGRGVIETYTVVHDYDGAPETGIIMGRLEDGRRFLANTPHDRSLLEGLMTEEAIGRSGMLTYQDGRQSFAPD